jgi:hypothetical protein
MTPETPETPETFTCELMIPRRLASGRIGIQRIRLPIIGAGTITITSSLVEGPLAIRFDEGDNYEGQYKYDGPNRDGIDYYPVTWTPCAT